MVAEHTTLSPLSPADEALFQRFIESSASLAALAASLKDHPLSSPVHLLTSSPVPASPDSPLPTPNSPSSLPSLYLWSTQPHIAPWLDFHKAQLAEELNRELITHKREVITHLRDLVKSAPNPIERRRAASSILRCVGSDGGTTLRGVRLSNFQVSRLHPPHHQPTSAPNRSDSPSHRLTPSPSPDLPISQSPDAPIPPSPNLPTPLATPSPEIPDSAVAELVLSLLREPENRRNHSTLRAFCTPKTLLAGIQVPPDPQAFSQRALDILRHHQSPRVDASTLSRLPDSVSSSPHSPLPTAHSPLQSRFRLTTTHGCGKKRDVFLALRRESVAHSWLLASLSTTEPKPP